MSDPPERGDEAAPKGPGRAPEPPDQEPGPDDVSADREPAAPGSALPREPSSEADLALATPFVDVDPDELAAPVTALRVAAFMDKDAIHFRMSERNPGLLLSTWAVDLGLHENFIVRMTIGVDGDEDEHDRDPGHRFGAVEAHHLWVRASINVPFEVARLPELMALANDWNRTRRWPTATAVRWPAAEGLPETARLLAEEHLPVRCGISNAGLLWWLRSIRSGTVQCLVELHQAALQGRTDFD